MIFPIVVLGVHLATTGQVDPDRAATYFKEAAALCEREAGRLWGVSLCGPMVIADPVTKTIATSQPTPDAPRPPMLGFANTALDWGGTRWSTFVWQTIPGDAQIRGRMLLHELFHRVQPGLGLFTRDGQNGHLDTPDGRYWLQLEWRALSAALSATGPLRDTAVRDALAFRLMRRKLLPQSGPNEQLEEIREGLAQYTGTVGAASTPADAVSDAIRQLREAPNNKTFVRTFAYPLGSAYGLLLDEWSPGWTRRLKQTDDLGDLLMAASKLQPAEDPAGTATKYGGPELHATEVKRDAEQQARVAELRKRFVDGPVLVIPGAGGSFLTDGVTVIPGAGTVYPGMRVTAEWGSLVADLGLRSTDQSTIAVPAPAKTDGNELNGDGWMLKLAPGWVVQPGTRTGDFRVVRADP